MKIERKDFLKMAGGAVVGGAIGHVFSGMPFKAIQWSVEWTQDQHVPPGGEEKFINSICQACPDNCGISIRMIAKRAVKIENNNTGCPVGQAILQMLYHPERVKFPLKRDGKKGSGKFVQVTWEEAIKDISEKISSLRKAGKTSSIAAVSSDNNDISSLLLERFITAAGSPNVYTDSGSNINSSSVNHTMNTEGTIFYDLENSDYVLSFSARLLEGWGNMASMNKTFLSWKKNGSKLVQIDTLGTRTASLADEWVPIKAGTESILALGIAHQLLRNGKRPAGKNLAEWSQIVLNQYTEEKVSQITGVPAETINKIARDFAQARRPLAVAGRGAKGISSSAAEIIAVQCLNNLAGNFGRPGGVYIHPKVTLGGPGYDAIATEALKKNTKSAGLDEFINKGQNFELLFINESNPVHRSTYGKKLEEKMSNAMVVSFMSLINDTANYSDYILPSLTPLETAAANAEESIPARYKSMHTIDIILKIAKQIDGLKGAFPWNSYKDLLKSVQMNIKSPGNFTFPDQLFKEHLNELTKKIGDGSSEYPLLLVPFEAPTVGDGDGMAFPYVLKTIDGEIYSKDKLWVHINPETADKEGICENSTVDIVSKRGTIGSVKVHLTKTVAPDVVAIPLGFGHDAYTSYAEDKGVNPKTIMSDEIDPITGLADWWVTRIKLN